MTTPTNQEWAGTLNSLAGTHGLSIEGAACAWAGVAIGSLGLLGALNYKAGITPQSGRWLGLQAVCNRLAGTTQLDSLAALQSLLSGTED